MSPLPAEFYARPAEELAKALLGKILVRRVKGKLRRARIVETEAYCGVKDLASHSSKGRTARTEVMFGMPGHLYVYLSYGMHWCCNPVCGPVGQGWAVLIRAVEPVSGLDDMRPLRPKAKRDVDLTNGPGKLTQALGITGAHNGADLVTGTGGVAIVDDGTPPPDDPVVTTRIGFGDNPARDFEWRWFVRGSRYVSRTAGAR